MKKYLGLVQASSVIISGRRMQLVIPHLADTKKEMKQWFLRYPDAPHVMMKNTEKLQTFFESWTLLNGVDVPEYTGTSDSIEIAGYAKDLQFNPKKKEEVLKKLK